MNTPIGKSDIKIEIIRSSRKTLAIEIRPDMRVIVRAPHRAPNGYIEQFISDRADWIVEHLRRMEQKNRQCNDTLPVKKLSNNDIKKLADKACTCIPGRVAHFAPLVGVTYGRITIRNQRTRWGSCSSMGNLNFNCLLMLAPPEVIDYVVVHELCHRKEMNHSQLFWNEVARVLPGYAEQEKWLKTHGNEIMKRMTGE
jgi:predicted metal-dependent hydrolase